MSAVSMCRVASLGLLATTLSVLGCASEPRAVQSPEAKSATTTTTTASRADSNKALVAEAIDAVWGRKDLDAIGRYFAEDLVNHAAIPEAQGASGMRTIGTKLNAAFPDLQMHVTGISADGDDVVVRVVFEGTHAGALEFTKMPLPATNKHVKVDQVHTFRVKDGRIVECWMVMDRLEMLTQLGVAPGRPPAP